MFKKHITYLSIIGILVMIIIAMSIDNIKSRQAISPDDEATTSTEVSRGDIALSVGGSGKIFANTRTVLKSQTENIISTIWVREGQEVHKGDPILEFKKDILESEIKMTKLNLEAANNELSHLLNSQRNLKVYAPISGVMDEIFINKGEVVEKGDYLGKVSDKSVMELRASFYKSQFDIIEINQDAEVFLPGYFVTLNGKVVGKINDGKPQPDGGIVYDVVIEVENPGGLASNTSTQVTIKNKNNGFLAAKSGKLNFKDSSNTYVYMDGIVKNIYVSEGEKVNKGQLILELNNSDLTSKIESQRINIKQIEFKLNEARSKLNDSTVYSPMNGTIQKLYVSEGEELTFNKSIASIINLKDLETVISVNKEDLSKVDLGQNVIITSKDIPKEKFNGKISKISLDGRSIDNEIKYDVTIKIDYSPKLKPTMNVDVDIISEEKKGVLVLPIEAVKYTNGEFTVKLDAPEEENYIISPIEVGLITDEYVEVLSGIKEGDKVIYSKFE